MASSDIIVFGFNLTTALPKISEETLKSVKERLTMDLGVSQFSELKYVEEKDIIDLLKPIQARSLIQLWKSDDLQVEEGSFHGDSGPLQLTSANVDARWAEKFEVNYNGIPKEIMTSIKKGQRLHPRLRRSFVRFVAEDIQKICKRPLKKDIVIISKKIVSKFPCLSDTFCNETIGIGCESLLKQILVRCENNNRKITYDKMPKNSSENIDDPLSENKKKESSSKEGKRKRSSYGALKSHPDLPDGESEEIQVNKQKEMKQMFTEKHKTFSADEANTLLNATFYLQRKFINLPKPIDFFIADWPLLLTKQGIFIHFRNLIGIDIEEKFKDSFEKKTERVLSVLEKKPDKDIMPSYLIELLYLLLKYFEEEKGFIMIEADILVSKNEVEQMKHLPKTPCIISCGNAKSADLFMLSVDSKIIIDTLANFWDCFLLLVACYFIFNIMYPEEASATLEFIQRCYLGINPDRGNKRAKNYGKHVIHPKVLKLIDKISNFEWL